MIVEGCVKRVKFYLLLRREYDRNGMIVAGSRGGFGFCSWKKCYYRM